MPVHTLAVQKTFPVSMTVADGTGIEKGTLLLASDPNTAAASTGANDQLAGILYTEKIASDGNTRAAVLKGPGDILRATASGSIGMNDALVSSATGASFVASGQGQTVTQLSGSRILGRSLETVTDGQTFLYELNISSLPRV